jgi:hypothetical protein
MAALPARRRFEAFGAESVDESAQPKQIGETADKVIAVDRWKPLHCLPIPIRPRRRNQRAAAVGQNGQEIVDAAPPEIADYGQRLALERMALAPDRHGRRNVMAMGSLRPLPSKRWSSGSAARLRAARTYGAYAGRVGLCARTAA